MSLFDWFADRRKGTPISKDRQEREIADGLWQKCSACGALTYTKDLKLNADVCPSCGYHNRYSARDRIAALIVPGTWQALDDRLMAQDPLKFEDQKPYVDRLKASREKTHLPDAVLTGMGSLQGAAAVCGQPLQVALGCMDFAFMGGSMGSVVGEKLTRLIETATQAHLPLIICSASGGARMHEGIFSLMQMAKTAAALERFRSSGHLYISVLTNPTYGGVTASFAMLGDIIVAEPGALVGFAGARVIEQTIGQKLPEGFQTAEYLLEHGLIDAIVPRPELPKRLAQLIGLHTSRSARLAPSCVSAS